MAFGVGPKTVFLKWAFATALVITNALGMVRMAHLTLAQGRLVTKSTKQKLTTKT